MQLLNIGFAAAAACIAAVALPGLLQTWIGALALSVAAILVFFARGLRGRHLPAVLAFGALAQFAYFSYAGSAPRSDFAVYEELAASLAAGKGFAYQGPEGKEEIRIYRGEDAEGMGLKTAWRAPGTAFLGAALYSIAGREPGLFLLWNIAAALLTAFLLSRLAESPAPGVLAAALWFFLPSTIAAGALFGTELAHTALLLAAAWTFDRDERFSGLLAGLACLFRPLTAVFAVAGLAAARFGAKRSGLFLAGLLAACAPWVARNRVVTGEWIGIAAGGSDVFARHTASLVSFEARDPAVYKPWREAATEAEKSRAGFAVGMWNMRYIWSYPPRALRGLESNLRDAFSADRQVVYWSDDDPTRRERNGLFATAVYACLWPAAVWGAWRRRNIPMSDGFRFLQAHFLLSFVLFLLIPSIDRYHFPMLPFAALSAGLALSPPRRYP